ncbi:MAG: hypothetical protein ACYDCK_14150 [Thermoplasmatota archaeon]
MHTSSDFAEKRREILALHAGIRGVAKVDREGKFVEGGMRPGVASVESSLSAIRHLIMESRTLDLVKVAQATHLGALRFVVFGYDEVRVVAFPLDGTMFASVTVDPTVPAEVFDRVAAVLAEPPPIARLL